MAAPLDVSGDPNDNTIEIEKLDEESFQILDNVIDEGTLAFEFSETKRKLALRLNTGRYVPLDLFRSRSKSIPVSDISSSLWCELQLEYRYLHPYLSATSEWSIRRSMGRPVQQRTKQMIRGSDIHYQKEREIREVVKVETRNMEDKCAVDWINALIKLRSVQKGNTEREIKVIGTHFGNMLLSGIIDQVQYCPSDKSFIILELKTRTTNTIPENSQQQSNHLQVMIYKELLDSLTQGHYNNYSEMLHQKGLRMTLPLTKGPIDYIKSSGLYHLFELMGADITLQRLVDAICKAIVDLQLPLVNTLLVQYIYQKDGSVIGIEPVLYDESWTDKMVRSAIGYWKGERSAMGVDIEDSWKCNSCQFNDVCVWRKRQVIETSPVKKWPREFYEVSSAKRLAF